MIIKSYQVKNIKSIFLKNNLYLLYGENVGLKKDIKKYISKNIEEEDKEIESIILYENEILNNEENFYNLIYSGSLFSKKKIIIINEATDKLFKKLDDIYKKYPENVFLIFLSGVLEKKSKLRNFFEKQEKVICIPCYLDNEKDLEIIALTELKKNNIILSKEIINLLIEKSNSDRNNLRNELEKIKSYSLNKKQLNLEEIQSLINFSGDYKSDSLVNECLCGNIQQLKKMLTEFYINTVSQILLLRILGNKIHRLLKIKKENSSSNNWDNIINTLKPNIFWKEKPLLKKQLAIWNLKDLEKIIGDINETELLCKKNPQVSKYIFLNFFSNICKKASNFS